jgi:MFS family permease
MRPVERAARRARLGVSAGFLLYGAAIGTWAARIPAVKADLSLGEGELGSALLAMAAGTLAGARLGSLPVARFGSGRTTRVMTPILCLGLAGPALAGDLAGLVVALACFGLAGGALDVAVNAQGVAVERAYGRPLLSGMHGLWSLGGLVGAAGGALAAGVGAGVDVHYGIAALVLALLGVTLVGRSLPDAGHAPAEPRPLRAGRLLWSLPVLLLGLVGFSAYMAEGSVLDWSGVYLREKAGASAAVAAGGIAAFSLAMTAGRLGGDRVVLRLGLRAVIRAGATLATVGFALGIAVPEPAVAVTSFVLVGVGLATVVPLTFSAAGRSEGPPGAVLGRVVTISYTGGMLGPVAIGWLAEEVGLRAALCVPAALAALVGALAGQVAATTVVPPR